jgi:hypothetical protein
MGKCHKTICYNDLSNCCPANNRHQTIGYLPSPLQCPCRGVNGVITLTVLLRQSNITVALALLFAVTLPQIATLGAGVAGRHLA